MRWRQIESNMVLLFVYEGVVEVKIILGMHTEC
jgi:hypothetical protein